MPIKLNIIDLESIAESRGGRLLSKNYTNNSTLLIWQCVNNHVFEAPAYRIKRGNWCRECYRLSKFLTLDEMQKIADLRGGKCISDVYYNVFTRLKWECKAKHTWEVAPHHILFGTWCPKCAKNKT